jgi:hypothetical protein
MATDIFALAAIADALRTDRVSGSRFRDAGPLRARDRQGPGGQLRELPFRVHG